MTDPELIAKKLSRLETYLLELRRLGRPDRIRDDLRERRFIEHTLLQAIQTAIDVASHIVSDERLGEPAANSELFLLLGRHGLIGEKLSASLVRMVGFRNVLVHNYVEFDLELLEDAFTNRLRDLDEFVAAIRRRLPDQT